MTLIIKTALPNGALHSKHKASDGYYTDCFETEVDRDVSLSQFVEAFYTSRLFKCERFILKYTIKRQSTDSEAKQIAYGTRTYFAAWMMEDRTETQLLMCDISATTKSWFMVEPLSGGSTRLRFGSVVCPKTGQKELPPLVKPLLRFHDLYSKMLLKGAVRRIDQLT